MNTFLSVIIYHFNRIPKCYTKMKKKKFTPSFHPFPYLDFENNSPPGASRTISTLKMSQMVEILISDLVLIVN